MVITSEVYLNAHVTYSTTVDWLAKRVSGSWLTLGSLNNTGMATRDVETFSRIRLEPGCGISSDWRGNSSAKGMKWACLLLPCMDVSPTPMYGHVSYSHVWTCLLLPCMDVSPTPMNGHASSHSPCVLTMIHSGVNQSVALCIAIR